jgi:hypothetical protein
MIEISNPDLKQLIQKYGLILIAFFILNQFAIAGMAAWIVDLIYPTEKELPLSFQRSYAAIISLSSILLNSIIALITLSDSRKQDLRWLIFFVTLVAPSVGVVFLIISKMIENKGVKDSIENT